jgi:hypothetical protein
VNDTTKLLTLLEEKFFSLQSEVEFQQMMVVLGHYMSQTEMSDLLSVSQRPILHWQEGKSSPDPLIYRIVYGKVVEYILEGMNREQSQVYFQDRSLSAPVQFETWCHSTCHDYCHESECNRECGHTCREGKY